MQLLKSHAFVATVLLLTVSCVEPDTNARLKDAAQLAGTRIGMTPEWESPWDESAATAFDVRPLSLPTAIAAALRSNPSLRADLETIGQADADLVQAGLMSNPVINFMMMFPSGGGRVMLRGNALPMQPLQDLWLIPARKKVAAALLREAVLRVADKAVATVAEVKQAYVGVQFAERAIELIRTNMELVEQSTSLIQIRQTAGRATQVEVNLSRIRRERLRSDVMARQTELFKAKYELLRLMGAASAPTDWSVTPLREIEDRPPAPRDEPEMILQAGRQRLDLKSREWQIEAALRRITLSRREGWPDLALGFTFERAPRGRTRGAGPRALGADTASQSFVDGLGSAGEPSGGFMPIPVSKIAPLPRPTREVTYTLGPMIELELPIFDWGQAQSAKAVHEYRQRLAEYDAQLQEIVEAVRSTLREQQEAFEQHQLFRDVILPEVEGNLELARQSYIAAQTDLTIYLQAQEDTIDTRLRMLEYLKTYHVLEARLERAVGGPASLESAVQATSSPAAEESDDTE